MPAPIHAKVVIIGSGPAGYTAAIYAARAMLEPVLIQGIQPGGQLTITTDVENYPGFADVIQGPWLMEQMEKQAAHVGTKIVTDLVTKLALSQRPFRLTCDSGDVYLAETVILATGAQARWLGIPSEEKFKGFGVSACATCDGFFYRGKEVVVVGGGNTAVEEAMFLTNFASQVTVVHRRDHFRAERILQDRLFKNPKIKVVWDSAIDEICGTENPGKVTHVRLKNVKTGTLTELPADGVFIAIGHAPATDLVTGQVKLKPSGYVEVAPNSTATSIPGLFAAGDVADETYRQAVTAAGLLILPSFAYDFGTGAISRLHRKAILVSSVLVVFTLVFAALVWLFLDSIKNLLFAGKYGEYAWLMPIMVLMTTAFGPIQGFGMALRAAQKPQFDLMSNSCAAFAAVLSSYFFTRWWGLAGAVASLALAFVVQSLVTFTCFQRWGLEPKKA